jgi:hypothetical protein
MAQPLDSNFDPIERREPAPASPVSSTACVPAGTLLNVPAVPPTGATGSAPVVAATTTVWYKDPQFVAAAGGALLALADPIVEALTSAAPLRWRSLIASCILAVVAYLRHTTNTVTR